MYTLCILFLIHGRQPQTTIFTREDDVHPRLPPLLFPVAVVRFRVNCFASVTLFPTERTHLHITKNSLTNVSVSLIGSVVQSFHRILILYFNITIIIQYSYHYGPICFVTLLTFSFTTLKELIKFHSYLQS